MIPAFNEVTNIGATIAGVLAGGVTVIVWKRLEGGLFDLYEIIPGFVLSSAAILVFSLVTPPPEARIRQQFENLYD